eukprot:4097610-Prymnesium_polylepis.1
MAPCSSSCAPSSRASASARALLASVPLRPLSATDVACACVAFISHSIPRRCCSSAPWRRSRMCA